MAHPGVVLEGVEVVTPVRFRHGFAVVGEAVRCPGVVLAEQARHRPGHRGRVQQVGEHRNPRQQVVAQQRGTFVHADREFRGDRVVERRVEPRVEGQKAVRHVAAHLLVAEQDRMMGHYASSRETDVTRFPIGIPGR